MEEWNNGRLGLKAGKCHFYPSFHYSIIPIFQFFLTMKRFLSISILLHAAVLLLLFSWEIPLADRLLARSVVEVSLVERIEGKPEGKKEEGDKKSEKKSSKKEDIQGKKKAEATRGSTVFDPEAQTRRELAEVRVARAKEELKVEEPKPEKIEPPQKEIREERVTKEEGMPPEPLLLTSRSEEFPVLMARLTPSARGTVEMRESASPLKDSPTSVFVASSGPESGQEGIAVGGGGKASGAGPGEGGTSRFTGIQKSSGDGDSILAEIVRRIEGAKRYPRMARKMGMEGRATVRFKLKADGRIEKAELLETSGSEILDQASLETVHRAVPLPYKEGWLKVVIIFKIL